MASKKSKTGKGGEEIKTKDAVALLGVRPDQFGAVAKGLTYRKEGVSKYYLLADIERLAKERGVKIPSRGAPRAAKVAAKATSKVDGRSRAAKAAKAKSGAKTSKVSGKGGEEIKTKDAVALLGVRPDQFGALAKGLTYRKEGVSKYYLLADIERLAKERGVKVTHTATQAKASAIDGDRINTRDAIRLLGVTRARFLEATKGLETRPEGVSKTYLRADILALAKKGIPRGKPGRPAASRPGKTEVAASIIASAQASFSAQDDEEPPPASSARPTFQVNLPPEPEGLTPDLIRVVVSYLRDTPEWNANEIMVNFGARPSQITYLQAFYRSEQDRITYEQQVREYEQKRAERKAAEAKAEAERKAAAEKEEAEKAEAKRLAAEKAAAEKAERKAAAEKAAAEKAAEKARAAAAEQEASTAAVGQPETLADHSPNPTHTGFHGDDPEESGAAALDRQFGGSSH